MPGFGTYLKKLEINEQRQEILDWYHLKENLYKVGGSIKRLKLAETMLWQGKVDEVINSFKDFKGQAFKTVWQLFREPSLPNSQLPILQRRIHKFDRFGNS
jgi:hypothetical protein